MEHLRRDAGIAFDHRCVEALARVVERELGLDAVERLPQHVG